MNSKIPTYFPEKEIDSSWTLFLDRDGTINTRLIDDYVKNVREFEFINGALMALTAFAGVFGRILIVTNQQGIGKGVMREGTLHQVHENMIRIIMENGGRIDKIYYCPELKTNNSIYRKPNIGMGLKAKKDYPEIDFRKSVMVGDSISDMLFGKNLNMYTVLLSDEKDMPHGKKHLIDRQYSDLKEFASSLGFFDSFAFI